MYYQSWLLKWLAILPKTQEKPPNIPPLNSYDHQDYHRFLQTFPMNHHVPRGVLWTHWCRCRTPQGTLHDFCWNILAQTGNKTCKVNTFCCCFWGTWSNLNLQMKPICCLNYQSKANQISLMRIQQGAWHICTALVLEVAKIPQWLGDARKQVLRYVKSRCCQLPLWVYGFSRQGCSIVSWFHPSLPPKNSCAASLAPLLELPTTLVLRRYGKDLGECSSTSSTSDASSESNNHSSGWVFGPPVTPKNYRSNREILWQNTLAGITGINGTVKRQNAEPVVMANKYNIP